MKDPQDKPDKLPLTRADVETIMRLNREHVSRLVRLKEAILAGDSILEHELAREVCGLPKETTQ